MAQTPALILVHGVFSTEDRAPFGPAPLQGWSVGFANPGFRFALAWATLHRPCRG